MNSYPQLDMYIAGQWVRSAHETKEVINPATEEAIGNLPCATSEDVAAAIIAADNAFDQWKNVSHIDRADILRKAIAYIEANQEELATIITLEQGKPRAHAFSEIARACEHFQWASEETKRLYGRVVPSRQPGGTQYVYAEPIGPVAAFSGWNAPAVTPARKLAAVLGAGCTLVIKPAEETPATALFLVKALEAGGLPKGVVNVVFGDPAKISAQLLESPLIKGITFTGATSIGKSLATQAAGSLKRMVLELGGHAPALVFADADPKETALTLARAKFQNSGQICTSPTRILVHESISTEFNQHFVAYAQSLQVGDGMENGVTMGPLSNPRRLGAVEHMVADALAQGGQLLTGGTRPERKGYFYTPTVLANYSTDWEAAQVEPFGPLALLGTFSTEQQALTEANRLPYGLAAYVFTNNAKTIQAMVKGIESGVVCVNHCVHSVAESPFGGYRDSGYGKEGGIEGFTEFLRYKYVSQV